MYTSFYWGYVCLAMHFMSYLVYILVRTLATFNTPPPYTHTQTYMETVHTIICVKKKKKTVTHSQAQQIHMGIQPHCTLTRVISRHRAETSSILIKHLQLACNLLR